MRIFTVGQVNGYLREILESDPVLVDLWVSGEVSNFVRSAAGHLYFTLKDRDSQLRCAFFRPGRKVIPIENGLAVIAHGRISLYEANGALQFYVNLVQPEGVGLLNLQFEELKARLEAEGLFDPGRKRPLPRLPKRVGVVTSPTGAVIHDILTIARRRYPLAEIVIAPALMQGDGAPASVIAGLAALNQLEELDAIVLARGGGSLEELWCFNEEAVARAIYASRVPVVSAIGHETDYTIADFVADCRAPTPSAAAEIVFPDRLELGRRLDLLRRSLLDSVGGQLAAGRDGTDDLAARLIRARPALEPWRQRVDDLTRALEKDLGRFLGMKGEQVRGLSLRLNALSPLLTLARGYAVVQLAASGETVVRTAQVRGMDRLKVRVTDGTFDAEVVD